MRKTTSGFTIVELLVVIAIIGVLISISILPFSKLQANARDSQRTSKITVVAESLEKYYDKNGEYPNCTDMTQSAETVASTTLAGIDSRNLSAPNASSGANSFVCDDPSPSTDDFSYIGGGSQYTLEYRSEKTGEIISYDSRHSFVIADGPDIPTVTIGLNSNNIIATIAATACDTPAITQYHVRNRTNNSAWSNYTDWSTSQTASQPAVDGVKYGYQAQARCYQTDYSYSPSVTSTEAIYIDPISPPAVTAVSASTNGPTTTYSWSPISCPADTTVYYRYRYVINYSGSYTSPWYGTTYTSEAFTTSLEGYQYTGQVQSHCYNDNTTSAWSGAGQASYVRPVAAPSGGINFTITRSSGYQIWYPTSSTCTNGTTMYSRDDLWLPDPWWWYGTSAAGWYSSVHGGAWADDWNNYGNPTGTFGITFTKAPFPSGLPTYIAVDLQCRNTVTGLVSSTTGRVQSPVLYSP
jgi:prepilin-type N-terminal cleavage/methylation domain-containing protein